MRPRADTAALAGGAVLSAIRAWWVGHYGTAVLSLVVGLTAILLVAANALLPVPGQVRALPIWQLIPPAYAMVAALATVNLLPDRAVDARIRWARLTWMGGVAAIAGLCVAGVDRWSGLPALAPATMALAVATFGAATLLGRSAVWLGAGLAVLVVTHLHRFASTANPWSIADKGARIGITLICVIAALGYVFRGGRRQG